jgi:hypothetical protein
MNFKLLPLNRNISLKRATALGTPAMKEDLLNHKVPKTSAWRSKES